MKYCTYMHLWIPFWKSKRFCCPWYLSVVFVTFMVAFAVEFFHCYYCNWRISFLIPSSHLNIYIFYTCKKIVFRIMNGTLFCKNLMALLFYLFHISYVLYITVYFVLEFFFYVLLYTYLFNIYMIYLYPLIYIFIFVK